MFEKEKIRKLNKEYRQSVKSIEEFVDIQNEIMQGSSERIIVSVEETEHIADGLMVLLGTLPELNVKSRNEVRIRFKKSSKFADKLASSGVLQYYRESKAFITPENDKIRFCRPQSLEEYLNIVKNIMEMTPVKFEPDAYAIMSSKLYEVFDNAVTHGKSDIGVFSYGNVLKDKFTFSVYDLGIGIQQNVNNFRKRDEDTRKTMEWALESGHSTKLVDYPRGAGFTLLESFIQANNGIILLCSDDMICRMTKNGRTFHKMRNRIIGTLFIMTIRADKDSVYSIRR